MEKITVRDLGLMRFREAWAYQEELLRKTVDAKTGKRELLPREPRHHLLYCEHPHVVTLGKSGDESHLLVGKEQLEKAGAEFYRINRGGDITYHGPGQLVAYPVLDLDRFFTDIHRYMRFLEESVIRTLATFGLRARRVEKCTGVWLDSKATGRPAKICAMGVRCSRWVTMHGLALNVNTDLSWFGRIVPCGIDGGEVTSMQQELGSQAEIREVKAELQRQFGLVFGARMEAASTHDGALTS